jgi:hypothetical protein
MFMGVPSGVKTGSRRDTAYEGTNGDPAETLYGGYTSGYELAPKRIQETAIGRQAIPLESVIAKFVSQNKDPAPLLRHAQRTAAALGLAVAGSGDKTAVRPRVL